MYGSFVDDWKTPDEYISRKAAEKAIAAAMPSMSTPDGSGENDHLVLAAQEMCVDAIKAVREVPAAEVAPVVHGKWLLKHIGAGHYWECSACHENPCIYVTNNTKFCPNCGAKMDRGK